MNSDRLLAVIAACSASHRTLDDSLAGLDDVEARSPSLLPNWTVGHTLTHIARNADGLRRMAEGAERGEVLAMYAGGRDGRTADIEAGAVRPAVELIDDVHTAGQLLDTLLVRLTERGWAGHGVTMAGDIAISDLPERRRFEVEVHRVDLGLGYRFADWPADLLRSELGRLTGMWASRKPMGFSDLPSAAFALAPADRLAWLLGRLEVDGLAAAGIF